MMISKLGFMRKNILDLWRKYGKYHRARSLGWDRYKGKFVGAANHCKSVYMLTLNSSVSVEDKQILFPCYWSSGTRSISRQCIADLLQEQGRLNLLQVSKQDKNAQYSLSYQASAYPTPFGYTGDNQSLVPDSPPRSSKTSKADKTLHPRPSPETARPSRSNDSLGTGGQRRHSQSFEQG